MRRSSVPAPPVPARGTVFRRAAEGKRPTAAESLQQTVEPVIGQSGDPLEENVRADMQARLGHDFFRVRVHADDRAAQSADALAAHAYTVGPHVVFANGRYAPHTSEGRRLLTHELVHTLQQPARPSGAPLHLSGADDATEREADAIARTPAAQGAPPAVTQAHAAPLQVARQEVEGPTIDEKVKFRVWEKERKKITDAAGIETWRESLRTLFGSVGAKEARRLHARLLPGPKGDALSQFVNNSLDPAFRTELLGLLENTFSPKPAPPPIAAPPAAPDPPTPEFMSIEEAKEDPKFIDKYKWCVYDAFSDELWLTFDDGTELGIPLKTISQFGSSGPPGSRTVRLDMVVRDEATGVLRPLTLSGHTPRLKQSFDIAMEVRGDAQLLAQLSMKLLELDLSASHALQPMGRLFMGGGKRILGTFKRLERFGKSTKKTPVMKPPTVTAPPVEPPKTSGKTATSGPVEKPPATSSAKNVVPIEEGHRIRARKAQQTKPVPKEVEEKLASGDRPRASSGGGKKTGPGGEDVDAPRQKSESSGRGETNVPPDDPPLRADPKPRGSAIEDLHLASMPEFSKPPTHNFPGIDGWKNGVERTGRVLPNGRKVRVVTGADVVQVKSVDASPDLPKNVRDNVKAGVAGLNADPYEQGALKVMNPKTRTLDVLFDEGTVKELTPEIRTLLLEQSAFAGQNGIAVRWFRFSNGTKLPISL